MKGSKMKKRILAALLCTTMVLNTGVSAMADEGAAALTKSAHVHTESCYEKNKTDQLICTKAEAAEGHVHGDECYEVTSTPELICTQEETAGHTHDDGCMETTKNLTCGKEEHTHDGDCYKTETKDVCSDESEEHTCGDGCVETEEVLKCEKSEHTHDDGCYESETKKVCGQDEVEAHTHGEGCYTTAENKTLKCTLEEVEAHTHNDDCYAWEEKLVCTLPETAPAAEQPEKEEKAEEAEEAAEVNLQNDDETGIKVSVKSTSDVIPEDTKVVVAPMEMDEEHEAALAEAVSEFEVLGYTAYDISLKDAEDEDITLGENKVEVVIDFEELIPEGINAEEVKDVVLVHITTDEEEKLTAETVGTVEITEEKATVEFEAESFSPYVVTYLSEAEEAVEEVVVEEPVVEDVVLTYTSEDEAYTATVTGTPEVLENVTAFEAVPVTDEEKITALTEQLTAKAAEMQKTSLGFENYEFRFMDAEGNEAVVDGKVKVSLSFAEARLPEAATAENVDAVDAALLETAEEGLEEINGLISAEAGAVKEVVYTTEAPEELILAWSGDVYRTLPNYEDDDVVITLAGTEYALQNVVGFNVTPIKEEVEETKEQYAEVAKQLEEKIAEENEAKEEEKAVVGFLAYDITLVDAEGNELEPQGGVRVSMEYKEAAAPEAVAEAEEVTVMHLEEDAQGKVAQVVDMTKNNQVVALETTESNQVAQTEFVTNSFSVFTITWIRTGDGAFTLENTNFKVLVANGSGYSEIDNSENVIKNITISSTGTPPTLYADSITKDGANKALATVTLGTGDNEKTYQFVKMIVARKTNGNTIQMVHLDPVIAIQAMKDGDESYLRYMLDGMGFYYDVRDLKTNEFLAFVYMDGDTTVKGTYWSEGGEQLSENFYNFSQIISDQDYNPENGLYVEAANAPVNAPTQIKKSGTTYHYSYIAIEQLGRRIIPAYLRYVTETGQGTNETVQKLQYRLSTGADGKESEWVDVVDADIRLIYKRDGARIKTENTAGIVDIDLFNYNITSRVGDDNSNFGGYIGGLFFGTGWQGTTDSVYNQFTGGVKKGDKEYANLALLGMVESALDKDGYPVLAQGIGSGGSLASLFDHSTTVAGTDKNGQSVSYPKDVYAGLNHLFYIPTEGDFAGYYRYDSSEHYAYFNTQNGNRNFTIYDDEVTKVAIENDQERGDFMPFISFDGEIDNQFSNEDAYHFGMTIGFDFIQPEDGKVNGEDMIFEFSGDDDVWVFVDGKLVLDVGGMHSEAGGIINFTDGTVKTVVGPPCANTDYANDLKQGDATAITMPASKLQSKATIGPSAKEFQNIFTKDELSGNTFEGNTVHRLEFFYLERGADMTNCAITFNLQPMNAQDIEVEKQIVNTDKEKYGDVEFTYELYLEKEVGTDSFDKIPEGTLYKVTRDGEYLETRAVTENGRFVLKHGEIASFENINNSLKYYVREIGVNDIGMSTDQFDAVFINGSAATYFNEQGQKVDIKKDETDTNSEPVGYIAQSEKVTPKQAHKVLFQNTCAESNKQELHIQKLFEGNRDLLNPEATFTFRVMLEDRDGNMVPYKNGKYFVVTKDVEGEVEGQTKENGVISGIKVDQTVIIREIMSGTDFYVEEIELDDKYQTPSKVVVNRGDFGVEYDSSEPFECKGSNKIIREEGKNRYTADGVILVNKNAKVKIFNALKFNWEIIKTSTSKDSSGENKVLPDAKFELRSADKVYTGKSDDTGKIIWTHVEGTDGLGKPFKNKLLKPGQIEPGTYILKEIEAPEGYSLSIKEWQVIIDKVSVSIKEKFTNESGDVTYGPELTSVKLDTKGTVYYTVSITNNPMYELPSTGGHGIYTTMLSGFALMLGAAYVWFTSRRKEMLQ